MNPLTATLLDGSRVPYRPEQIGEGGMKRVFFTADRQSVVCFFKDLRLKTDPNRMERLKAILGRFNPTTDPQTGKYFAELFCWPTGVVTDPQFGVLAPTYPKNFFFKTGPWQGKEKEGKWFSSPKLRKMLPAEERGVWSDYLRMCVPMARAVRKLHLTGLAHSDLSSRNVLVDPPGGRCAVIDIDSLVVPGVFPPDVLGTPGYIAPEVLATQSLAADDRNRRLPSNLTDLHALAVLIYEYLLRRHPLRGPKVNGQTAEEDELLSMGLKSLWIENPARRVQPRGRGRSVPPAGAVLAGPVRARLHRGAAPAVGPAGGGRLGVGPGALVRPAHPMRQSGLRGEGVSVLSE